MIKAIRPYARHGAALLSVTMMLVAFIFLQPWSPLRFPSGFPAGGLPGAPNTASAQPAATPAPNLGFQPATGGTAGATTPGGFPGGVPPLALLSIFSNPLILLVPVGALVALVATLLSVRLVKHQRLLTQVTIGAGVIGSVYFGLFFLQGNALPSQSGFWIALAGTAGLIGQAVALRTMPVTITTFTGDVVTVEDAKVATAAAAALITTPRKGGIDLTQNLGVAFDALLSNKMRSGLTMLGVVIGVMSVVALLSIGRGAQASITDQISGTGLNLLTVTARTTGSGRNLTYDDAEALQRTLTGVNAVLPQYGENVRVRSDDQNILTSVQGVVEQYAGISNLTAEYGRFLTAPDLNSSARVAVLGKKAASELFGEIDPLGRSVRMNGLRFEVIGVLAQQDSGFGNDPNLTIFVPLTTAYRNLFNAKATGSNKNLVSSIRISVTNLEDVTTVKTDAERVLRQQHRLKAADDNDFNLQDQQQLLNTANQITSILTVLLGAIAGVSLLVGGIGIMNISLVSVTERTKEIGLRKAIGARKGRILQQFLIETTVLSTLGGVIGVLLGIAIAVLVNATGLLESRITADSIVLGLGFSILVGIFFGVYPASRAAALQPIEALRYE